MVILGEKFHFWSDTVFDSIENTQTNDPTLVQYNDTTLFIKTSKNR